MLLAYRNLRVPSDAPFELRPSPGKGWGAFATRRIKRGATILREKPLFVVQKAHVSITEEDIRTAFQHLAPVAKQQFLHLRDNADAPFQYMENAFAENSFAVNRIGSCGTKLPAHGLFVLHSRFNHSCMPNSKIPDTNNETFASFATQDIIPGEEITFCYNPDFECRNRHERHELLRFACDCKACLPGTPFQQLSDMRRTMIRGLQYLTLGTDLDGKQQDSTSSIIVDPKLKKAAENFRLPLSSRLIYDLLTFCLLDEEGLLDDFMFERINPGLMQTVGVFQTESNARIAKLAMAQKTGLGKLSMALKLDGRTDIADHDFGKLLRMSRNMSIE